MKAGRDHANSPDHPPQRHGTRVTWWKKPVAWTTALIGAFILAVATAVGTGLGGTIVTAIKRSDATVQNPARLPITIEQVAPINTAPNGSFVVPGTLKLSPAQLRKLNEGSSDYLAAFEAANHAVPTASGFTSITVMGNSTKTVTITGLQVIKHCRSPLDGSYFYNPPAGENSAISLGFDLDSQITYAQNTHGGYYYSGNFFPNHVVTLARGETHTFAVYVSTARHYCRFNFQMTVATPNGVVTERIPRNGSQFGLTATADQVRNESSDTINTSSYRVVYVGGVADAQNNDVWLQVNPKTYNGLGNPASFPPSK